jgi:AraC family transcriptional regulator
LKTAGSGALLALAQNMRRSRPEKHALKKRAMTGCACCTKQDLSASALIDINDFRCSHRRSGPGPAFGAERPQIMLVRRGCFVLHVGTQQYLIDACTASLHADGTEYRVSHPGDAGDDCTIVFPSLALLDEAFGARGRRGPQKTFPFGAREQRAHFLFYALSRRDSSDNMASTEAALDLVRVCAQAQGTLRAPVRRLARAAGRRRIVDLVKGRLNGRLDCNVELETLAQDAGCSPFHLMRLFRAETGSSIRHYRVQLRLAAALARLEQREANLAGLAAELGFSSHSHLADTTRRWLQQSPSELRSALSRPSLRRLRRFLEAPARQEG